MEFDVKLKVQIKCNKLDNNYHKLQESEIIFLIDHYNPSLRIIDLVSYTIYVVCLNFKDKWRGLQFKVDSERQIF